MLSSAFSNHHRSLRPNDRLLVAAGLPVDHAPLVEVRFEALGWDDAHALLNRNDVPSDGSIEPRGIDRRDLVVASRPHRYG